jgi:hypothetical protein
MITRNGYKYSACVSDLVNVHFDCAEWNRSKSSLRQRKLHWRRGIHESARGFTLGACSRDGVRCQTYPAKIFSSNILKPNWRSRGMQEVTGRARDILSVPTWRDGRITGADGRIVGKDACRDAGRGAETIITISRVRELFQSHFFHTHAFDM